MNLASLISSCNYCDPLYKFPYKETSTRLPIVLSNPQEVSLYWQNFYHFKTIRNLLEVTGLNTFDPKPVPILKCLSEPANSSLETCSPFIREELSIMKPLGIITTEFLVKYLFDFSPMVVIYYPLNIPRLRKDFERFKKKIEN